MPLAVINMFFRFKIDHFILQTSRSITHNFLEAIQLYQLRRL